MFFYTNYKYAPRATLMSVLGNLLTLVFAVCGIACIASSKGSIGMILGGIAAIGAGVGVFLLFRKLQKKIAAKDGQKNIQTKASYGLMYVREHPEQYEYIRSVNQDFARKYIRNEAGKIVKNKEK